MANLDAENVILKYHGQMRLLGSIFRASFIP